MRSAQLTPLQASDSVYLKSVFDFNKFFFNRFLSNFQLKRALQFKEDHKGALADLLPSDEEKAFLETGAINVLVNRDQKERRIMVLFAGAQWDPNILSTEQIFRMFYLIHQAALVEPKTQIHGAVVLFDFEGLPLRNVRALTPAFALKLLTFCQVSVFVYPIYEVCSKSIANFRLFQQLLIFSSILISSYLKYSLFDVMHF